MAFCTNCGATVNGAFCTKCGAPANAAAQAAPPPPPPQAAPPAYAPPVYAQPPAQAPMQAMPPAAVSAPRKTSPLVWILVVVLGLFVLGGVATVGGLWYVAHRVKQAGFDPELMQRNPGLAISKMIAAANPDVEVVTTDEGKGTVTLREKSTGKVVTLNFDDVKNGKISFSAEGNDGGTATVEIGGDAAAKAPSWVPAYPGATSSGGLSLRGSGATGEGGSFVFSAKDAPPKVIAFYQQRLQAEGMTVNQSSVGDSGGTVNAEDAASQRTVAVVVAPDGYGGSSVNVTFGTKR